MVTRIEWSLPSCWARPGPINVKAGGGCVLPRPADSRSSHDNQPGSALSQWYEAGFARGGGRARKIGIVAVARKLLIALWRWLDHGVLPEGAQLKAAA